MIQFQHIESLYLLGLIPILILAIFFYSRWRKKNLLKFSTVNLHKQINNKRSSFRVNLKYTLQIFSIIFLIIGISNPKIGSELKEEEYEGIEIIIALDVSNSMLCEDIQPSRLERSRQAILDLIDNLKGDNIGIVVFAGNARTLVPITADYNLAKMLIPTVSTKSISSQGTDISKAIDQSMSLFNFENGIKKSIIIMTDGEDHENIALESAEEAAEKGVFIHTLSIGEKEGGLIPKINKKGKKTGSYKKDRDQNVIVTIPNTTFLSKLAEKGKGKNINANNSRLGLKELFKQINEIEKTKITGEKYEKYISRFQIFLFFALILLICDLMIIKRKHNLLKKILKR